MKIQKGEMKAWAREKMVGVEGCIFPSFTPDLSELDEEGIRWDVRQSIRHGFFSVLCSVETGLSFEEAKRFVSIVTDEAKDKLCVSTTLLFDSFEKNRAMLEHAEKAGCDTVLFGYPQTFYPKSEDEIYAVTKELLEGSNLPAVLYPSPHYNFQRLHMSGFPPALLSRLADLPNAVAIKVGEPGLATECWRRFGDKLLVNCPVERMLPMCVLGFRQQWIGAGCYEVFQSPEKPYLVQYFELLRRGKYDEAMEIYWMLTPARVIFEQQFQATVMLGTYHWPQHKLYQWCVGGNGGYTRQPCMKLHQHEIEATKMAFRMIGIEPRDNDEEYYVGRANYERRKKGGGKTAPPNAEPAGADLSGLTLPDAHDADVAFNELKGRVVVLYGGGRGAVEEGKKWEAAFSTHGSALEGAAVYQIAFLGGLPPFVPKAVIKGGLRSGPPTLCDWEGSAEKLLGLDDPNTAQLYVVDKQGAVQLRFAGACTDEALARVLAKVRDLA